ncbi:MAG: hypothetical protein H0W08_16295 [Acidobacteria bacterium]|nr:hypothetical protein [Acidobacteriota bacterium]
MAKRQDSGSDSAHQNQRPNEDAVPDSTDETRGLATDADDDEFEDSEDVDDEEEEGGEEGSF